eukprot:12279395-Ditylum_brightwellii.AAC.1
MNAYNITSSSSHDNNNNKHNCPIQNFTPSDARLRYLTNRNNNNNKKETSSNISSRTWST